MNIEFTASGGNVLTKMPWQSSARTIQKHKEAIYKTILFYLSALIYTVSRTARTTDIASLAAPKWECDFYEPCTLYIDLWDEISSYVSIYSRSFPVLISVHFVEIFPESCGHSQIFENRCTKWKWKTVQHLFVYECMQKKLGKRG